MNYQGYIVKFQIKIDKKIIDKVGQLLINEQVPELSDYGKSFVRSTMPDDEGKKYIVNLRDLTIIGFINEPDHLKINRPPPGLVPKPIHEQTRFEEVCAAILRYCYAGKKIPINWFEEYNELVEKNVKPSKISEGFM